MAELVNSIAEVFATLLRAIGFVGRPRRRAAIREDLALLRELDDYPGDEFGVGTAPHIWMVGYIYQQVGEFVGLDFSTEKRKAPMSSIIGATVVWVFLAWLSYHLINKGYGWWTTFPIVFASLLFISTFGMLTEKEPVATFGDLSEEHGEGEDEEIDLSAIEDLSAPDDPADNESG